MKKNKLDIVEAVMHYRSIMLLILGACIVFGVYSLINMPKNEFPTFTIRQGVVVGVYPGATSADVESQLTKPLEKFLWGFKEIKKSKTYSQTKDGICYVFVELNDNIKDKDEFWSKFKHRLQQFKTELPPGVMALIANDDFGDTSAMLITLESKNKTYHELHNYMTDLQDSLRVLPSIANLRVYGEQQEQIGVYIDRDRLSTYGINAATIMANMQAQGMTIISGNVDDKKTVRPIHIRSNMSTENEVAQQIVYSDPNGNVVRLRDIATIKREYPESDSYIKNNGTKCIVLSLEMNEGNNIVHFGDQVKSIIKNFKHSLPSDVSIYPITDQSTLVNHSILEFLQELFISICSVIFVIMLLLPIRVASVAAATIPMAILMALGVFMAGGIELNTVTLAALIVTLGMIVDNSIVIIDCYIEKIDSGMSRWHAASLSAKEFFSSIFSATLAISITFFPLLLTMRGQMLDFVKWFPIAVSIILGASLLVAVFVVPWMQYTFIKKGLKKDDSKKKKHKTFLDIMQHYYDILIAACFRHPFITLGIGAISVVIGASLFSKLPSKLMPRAERNQFAVEMYLPSGTAIEHTAAIADSLSHMMKKDPRVLNITTFYGNGSPRFQMSYAPQLGGTNFAQFIVNTENDKATEALLDKFTPLYSNYFANAQVRFKQLDYSDAKAPIEIRFSSSNYEQIHKVVDEAMKVMRKDTDLVLVRSNFEGTTSGINVVMNSDEANRLGINKSLLAMNLATRFGDGIPMTTVWEGDYPVKVMLKDNNTGKQTVDDLNNATVSGLIPTPNIHLRQIADVKPDWRESMIVRRNGVRTISVFADLRRGVNTNRATDKTIANLKTIHMPTSVSMKVGGQRESDDENGPQIYGGLSISIIIIFVILLFHFRDIRLSLLIMASLTFSLLGAALGILIMNQNTSMTGILGMISLMGIIVRNGIIMIDYAEELRIKDHLSAKHAAINAAKRRMRPIFLTSAAASMGVIPMVIQNSPMWGPMGVVVCFGTIVAMFFIITMIPVGYWIVFRIEDHKRHLKNEKERAKLLAAED
ncbi:efflux RND transporter permease subunit [Xylanibacter oryzae]|uniref:efflux RND transporter permease subunit n=1 Tax=Xylanibacter oryzae TaxID=185293 RepID=UPI0004B3690B|nr:efflux RND transporter permease subunit [Xylanibacter oryzae]